MCESPNQIAMSTSATSFKFSRGYFWTHYWPIIYRIKNISQPQVKSVLSLRMSNSNSLETSCLDVPGIDSSSSDVQLPAYFTSSSRNLPLSCTYFLSSKFLSQQSFYCHEVELPFACNDCIRSDRDIQLHYLKEGSRPHLSSKAAWGSILST